MSETPLQTLRALEAAAQKSGSFTADSARFGIAVHNLTPELLALWEAAEESRLEGESVRLPKLERPCVCPTCEAVIALNTKAREVLK